MRIVPVPCLSDNYAYLVIDEDGRAAVVDPSEAEPVREALAREGATLTEIWLTHHHHDHVGGVDELVDAHPDVRVLGSEHDHTLGRLPRQTDAVRETDVRTFGGAELRFFQIPGHTLGALAFAIGDHLFTGDTLFLAGCGRVFEGTMPMMRGSLEKLRALPDAMHVWCGHEYTVANLQFAATVEPGNAEIAQALEEARATRSAGLPTVPGTLGREKRLNPFLRYDVPEIARGREPNDAFAVLRETKDRFRPS